MRSKRRADIDTCLAALPAHAPATSVVSVPQVCEYERKREKEEEEEEEEADLEKLCTLLYPAAP